MLDQSTVDYISKTIYRILPKEEYQAFIFGSWVLGTNRKFSDIDVGIEGSIEVPGDKKTIIEEVFENSQIPYRIDFVDFSTVSDDFKKEAKKKIIPLK